MAKSKPIKTETTADILDKIFAQVDPETLLAGALGAVAASGGLVPPFTKLLMSMNSEVSQTLVNEIIDFNALIKLGNPLTAASGIFDLIFHPYSETEPQTENEKKSVIAQRALIASGFMEGMMMMAAMKNPGTMEMLKSLISKIPSAGIINL